MDKMKSLAKGGWHPSTDRKITRENWKSDLKSNVGLGKKKDVHEESRNHRSAPLASLRDPDSFGPPPKHSAYYGADRLGAPAVDSGYAERKRQEAAEREAQKQAELDAKRAEPYRVNTSGLRTEHLPPPPLRRDVDAGGAASLGASTRRIASPALPPRAPPRQSTGTVAAPARTASPSAPPPLLPPRQNEYPDEYSPLPPPTYNEALGAPSPRQNVVASMARTVASRFDNQDGTAGSSPTGRSNGSPAINQGTMTRLGRAGVSVPGFGIGSSSSSPPYAQQVHRAATLAQGAAGRFGQSQNAGGGPLGGLPQRFAQITTTGAATEHSPAASSDATTAAAQKPPPPPPPPPNHAGPNTGGNAPHADPIPPPPPIPTSSKPKPF